MVKLKEYFYIVFSLLLINPILIKSQSTCQFKNNEELIYYYAKGVIPNHNLTSEFLNYKDFKWEFIHCINGYSTSTYIIKENGEDFFKNSGIFIGSSIDLGKLSEDFINTNLTSLNKGLLNKLVSLSGKFGEEAEEIFNTSGSFSISDFEIKIINKAVYSYYYSEMKKYYNIDKIKINYSLEMCLLTFFVKFYGLYNYLEESKKLLDNNQLNSLAYYFLNIKNTNYIQNKLWNIITLSSTQIEYNYHHISFYLDSKLKEEKGQNEIKKWISDFISMYNNRKNFYTLGNYSSLISDEQNNNIYNYSCFRKILEKYQFDFIPNENINDGIKKFEDVLEFNNSLFNNNYYQRHLIIFLNSIPNKKIKLDEFKEKGINVILIYRINKIYDYQQITFIFEDKFNLIPFYYYEDLNKDKNFSLMINSQINFYIESFKYKDNNIIEINNIKTIKKNNIQCFKIVYDEDIYNNKNSNETDLLNYFHVSLIYNNLNEIKYKYNRNANITFFISDNNPYSDILNYQLINFCFNTTVSSNISKSPFINYILPEDINEDNENYFYITIEGNDIDYSLRISLLKDSNYENLTISNGVFGTLQVQPITSELISTFSEKCIQKSCNVDYFSLVKYYASGLHYNSNNEDDLFDKIFDLNMFECLYKNYYCPFFIMEQKETIYNSGPYIGFGVDLPKLTEIELFKDSTPLYIINKLHPFLSNTFNISLSRETLEKYNLNLTYEELKIFNLEYLRSIFEQTKRLKYFDEFSDNIKLALFLRTVELGSTSGIYNLEYLHLGNTDRYLNALMKSDKTRTTSFESLNFQMLLIQATKINKLKKCLLSIVVGKSLLWSEDLLELINKFSNYRISLSYYDEENKKTVLAQYFTENINEIKNTIYSITQNSTNVEKIKNIDIDSIFEQQYSLFKYFDYGLKKSIIIISTHTNDTYNYNFSNFSKEKVEKLYELGINIFDYSDKINFVDNNDSRKIHNYNKEDYYNFYNSKKNEYIQFVPYLKYYDMSLNYVTLFNIINKFPIPINKIKNIYLDLHPDEEIIFEFNLTKEREKLKNSNYLEKYNILRFNFGPSNLDIYFSRSFPFPNIHSCDYNISFDEENKNTVILYDLKDIFEDYNNSKFYMTIISPKKVDDLYVNLELCNDDGTCMEQSFYFKFYIGFTIVGFLIFLYGLYICFYETTFKKESNIFDIK